MSKYVCINGELRLANDKIIDQHNRSFRYGDGIIETIRCLNSKALFFDKHFSRLSASLRYLKISLPVDLNQKYFEYQIEKLLQKNRIYKGAKCRIALFRDADGIYTPTKNALGFLIEVSAIENESFVTTQTGLSIGIYSANRKPIEPISALKTSSALIYVLAGIWKQENKLDDCFILNTEGKLIEALTSNLILVKDNVLFFTTNDCGCVDGTMRRTIIEIAKESNINYSLVPGFTESHILDVDEVLLSNAVQGVNYVGAYKNRRYFNSMTKRLNALLNQKANNSLKH